jgi:hypothetical protein
MDSSKALYVMKDAKMARLFCGAVVVKNYVRMHSNDTKSIALVGNF